jgi:hypothetical protein
MKDRYYRLGCDIGGTFTDFVLINDQTGELRINKCLTTPKDPSDAVEQGIRELEVKVPWHDPGHQLHYRKKGRKNRTDHHQGFQGCAGTRPGDPIRAL